MTRPLLVLTLSFLTSAVAGAQPAETAAPKTHYLAPDGKDSVKGTNENAPVRRPKIAASRPEFPLPL